MKHKIAIIQFPGSNTERETIMACNRVGLQPIEFLWNKPAKLLSEYSGYIIVGGFSYEDRSRAGIIAALDPIMKQLKIEDKTGKPILGICNGAQILVESGLVPGSDNFNVNIALTDNKRIVNNNVVGVGYYNAWANLKMSSTSDRCAFTRHLQPNDFINIPLAHGEGRFIIKDNLLNEMIKNHQTVFRYCNNNGNIIDEFPTNPNGSIYNLAAVCNPRGNVMAIMPHPERTVNGDVIFSSMNEYIKNGNPTTNHSLSKQTLLNEYSNYSPKDNVYIWKISTIITDNIALSVEQTLKKLGCDIAIERQIHWEIETESNTQNILKNIDASGELYNSNKEFINTTKKKTYDLSLLVRQKDDVHGRIKYESLTQRFNINGLKKIKRGTIWNVSLNSGNIQHVLDQIFNTNILHNPQSHECYRIN